MMTEFKIRHSRFLYDDAILILEGNLDDPKQLESVVNALDVIIPQLFEFNHITVDLSKSEICVSMILNPLLKAFRDIPTRVKSIDVIASAIKEELLPWHELFIRYVTEYHKGRTDLVKTTKQDLYPS